MSRSTGRLLGILCLFQVIFAATLDQFSLSDDESSAFALNFSAGGLFSSASTSSSSRGVDLSNLMSPRPGKSVRKRKPSESEQVDESGSESEITGKQQRRFFTPHNKIKRNRPLISRDEEESFSSDEESSEPLRFLPPNPLLKPMENELPREFRADSERFFDASAINRCSSTLFFSSPSSINSSFTPSPALSRQSQKAPVEFVESTASTFSALRVTPIRSRPGSLSPMDVKAREPSPLTISIPRSGHDGDLATLSPPPQHNTSLETLVENPTDFYDSDEVEDEDFDAEIAELTRDFGSFVDF